MGGVVSSILGSGGGAGGTGFSGPQSAPVVSPVTKKQAQAAYDANQQALQQQQQFLAAVQAQNGLQNQTNVYNQLQNVANGTGPNPAQAMLANATGQNVANQAALMAGQRGANANVGLIARQAAMQGANTQQQAAGQAANMQAQQSLNALNSLGNLATQQVGQQAGATQAVTNAQLSEQQALLNSIAGQNQANVGMQSNINNANASMAGIRMGQQGNLIGNIAGGIGSALSLAEGGKVPQMYAEGDAVQPGGQYMPVGADSPFNQQVMPALTTQIQGPAAQASAPVASAAAKPSGPQSRVAQHFQSSGEDKKPQGMEKAGQVLGQGIGTGISALYHSIFGPSKSKSEESGSGFAPGQFAQERSDMANEQASGFAPGSFSESRAEQMAEGGKVPALVSPGEQYLPPSDVKKVKKGANPLAVGEKIPGKPKYPGNDYRNDIVPKTLKSGGIVIPNAIMQSKNPAQEAAKFVAAIEARKKHKRK